MKSQFADTSLSQVKIKYSLRLLATVSEDRKIGVHIFMKTDQNRSSD